VQLLWALALLRLSTYPLSCQKRTYKHILLIIPGPPCELLRPGKHDSLSACAAVCMCVRAGVVREVYQGKATKFTCSGLKPAEYVLSVKAAYDDGSTLWSDSRAYRTNML
jgi:hypothetical protein